MELSFLRKIFYREENPFGKIESALGYCFRNKDLLKKALSHRSSVENGPSNERLEYLGDAVLGLVVSEFLFKRFSDLNEGDLTKMKASLVNEAVLSRVAGELNLGRFIYLSKEEEKSGGRNKPSIVADAAEAVLGAIYLDGGLVAAQRTIRGIFLRDFEGLLNDEATYNYKGELLEIMQGTGQGTPRYEVLKEIGPDHEKLFVISVSVDGATLGKGEGSTKKEAEQKAARIALEALNRGEKRSDVE
jgi:ribonuclease-3